MGSGYARKKKEARLLQEKFQKMQEELKDETAEGSAGGGLVTLTLNGEYAMTNLSIKPECVDPDDIEGLEDLIQAAYNEAAQKLEKNSPTDLSGMAGLGGLGSFM